MENLPPIQAEVQACINKLLAQAQIKESLASIQRDAKKTLQDQIEITEIPAPPFHEEKRGEELMRRFRALGLSDVSRDSEGNVLARRPGSGKGPVLVLAAHQDTVFPEGTDVHVREENGIYHGPGISDDALGLAVILQVLRTLQEKNIQTEGDLLFVASVGEEGNGDLRGSKYLFNKSGIHIDGFISIDGADVTRILRAATGSLRYRIHFDGPGGHSWKNYGTPSAIHAMGRAIAKIADVQPPTQPRTTFTCGTICGGTTVNSIAAHCEMELDMRSAGGKELEDLKETILPLIEQACEEENARWGAQGEKAVKLRLEPIGHRPGGEQDDGNAVLQAARASLAALGIPLTRYDAASTDHNIAISKGVPATTLGGGGKEGFNHNVKEWFDPKDAFQGPQLALLTALALVGIKGFSSPLLPIRK